MTMVVTKTRARLCVVIQVAQSPINPLRWLVSLDCGHDLWVTGKRRPARQALRCVHRDCKDRQ